MPISAPRGIRNNNPCNLKDFGINWKGLSSPRSDADGFCVFSEPAYGIRACAMDLLKDFNKDAQRTILELMQEFAPGKDSNPTKQYADYIADNIRTRTGLMVGIETELDLNRFDVLYAFIEAVIKFENGQQPYSKATITRGIVLAGVEPPKPKHNPELSGNATVATMGGLGALSTYINQAQPAIPLLQSIAQHAPIVLGLLIIGACGLLALRSYRKRQDMTDYLGV